MDDTHALDPAMLARLTTYAAQPRGNRSVRRGTVAELVPLLDATVPVGAIAARLGVSRHVVTYELGRLRRSGFPVPDRLSGGVRSPRIIAIEDDLRSGMPDAEATPKHGVTPVRAWLIQDRAGIPTHHWPWTEAERTTLVANQDRSAREVAALLGRTVRAVDTQRQALMREGRTLAATVMP